MNIGICYTWMQCSFKEFLEFFFHILLLHVATGRFVLTISLYSLQNVAHIQKHTYCVYAYVCTKEQNIKV